MPVIILSASRRTLVRNRELVQVGMSHKPAKLEKHAPRSCLVPQPTIAAGSLGKDAREGSGRFVTGGKQDVL